MLLLEGNELFSDDIKAGLQLGDPSNLFTLPPSFQRKARDQVRAS